MCHLLAYCWFWQTLKQCLRFSHLQLLAAFQLLASRLGPQRSCWQQSTVPPFSFFPGHFCSLGLFISFPWRAWFQRWSASPTHVIRSEGCGHAYLQGKGLERRKKEQERYPRCPSLGRWIWKRMNLSSGCFLDHSGKMRQKGRETKQNKPITTTLVTVMDILQGLSGTSGGLS